MRSTWLSILFLGLAGPLAAAEQQVVHIDEVAAEICAPEWDRLMAVAPDAWSNGGRVPFDPALAPETTAAFNKYWAGITAVSHYMGVFMQLGAQEVSSAETWHQGAAEFDLVTCLWPSKADQDNMVAFAVDNGKGPAERVRAKLFEVFNQFECMGIDAASEAMFSTPPMGDTIALDMKSIAETNMKACN